MSPVDDLLAGLDGTSVGQPAPVLLNELLAELAADLSIMASSLNLASIPKGHNAGHLLTSKERLQLPAA